MGRDFKFYIREHPKYEPVSDFYFDIRNQEIMAVLEMLTKGNKSEIEKMSSGERLYFSPITKNDVREILIYCLKNKIDIYASIISSCLQYMDEDIEYITEIMVF